MSRSPQHARGFTLIEVLVALALMSLIGTILIESLQVGGHTWRQVMREAANTDEVARAQGFLRERLATIYPARPAQDIASSSESFIGESDALEFSSAFSGHSAQGLVRYWVGLSRSAPANVEIRYSSERTLLTRSQVSDWSSEPLLAHVRGLSIQFWESSADSTGQWVSHWADNTKLPRLIRIEVHFAENDARRWPPLYIEPRIDARSNCVFDVVSRRCRGGV